ncbi:MAG TPA: hypothetical protein VEV17_17095 [Bryobacteraceae bacterium]|nr:hypothetical protein [Bryobacteraceae bacterium]
MRCLYCGKELALLKRLTGSEFCSETHKQRYHEEYNRIALSRLIEAQKAAAPKKVRAEKPETAQVQEEKPAREEIPAPAPTPQEAPAAQATQDASAAQAPQEATTAQAPQDASAAGAPPEVIEAIKEQVPVVAAAEPGAGSEQSAIEEAIPMVVKMEQKAEEMWEPVGIAEAIPDRPLVPLHLETRLYSEPWRPLEPTPTAPQWLFEGRAEFTLPAGEIVPLPFQLNFSGKEHPAPEAKVTLNEFMASKATPPLVAAMAASNTLPSAGLVELEVAPKTIEYSALSISGGICDFPIEVAYRDSGLLEVFSSGIAFPPEDADVAVLSPADASEEFRRAAGWAGQVREPAQAGAAEESETVGPESPRAALEALARLTETLAEEQEPALEVVSGTPAGEAVSSGAPESAVSTEEVEPVLQVTVALAEPVVEAAVQVEEPARIPSVAEETTPSKAAELIEMAVKTFAPPKPSPAESAPAPLQMTALLPRLTGLPLRPKIGLASPQTAQSLAAAQRKRLEAKHQAATSEVTGRAEEPAKAAPVLEQPAETAKSAATIWQPAKPQPASGKTTAAAEINNRPPSPPAKQAEVAGKTKAPQRGAKTLDLEKPVDSPAEKPESVAAGAVDHGAPSFGVMQAGSSWLSGLKAKLAIAAAVVAMAAGAYFIRGGKSKAPALKPAAAADKAGPSIMVGGGGWVEGWAGDPAGAHFGRQITIYRPSLKLSDYRIEFQGQIETKSLGWVFRASDPQNYYAMKLEMVSGGLAPKIALFKYLIADGRQMQVGRVPIDQSGRLDTLYSVRVDVQGPRFTTYIQGQQADIWTDDHLKSGGVGFLNEREERGRIKSVSVYLLNAGKQ